MPTPLEVLEPLRSGLVPVPAAQTGICEICHSSCDPAFPRCYPCNRAVDDLDADEVVPIALSVKGGLLHRQLRGYKDDRRQDVRDRMALRLAGLLAVFLGNHHACIGRYDSIALVPSAARTAMKSVIDRIPSLSDAVEPALKVTTGFTTRDLDQRRFDAVRSVKDEHILLLDDTFTTGASLFSAAAALRSRGAAVTTLVLGRHVNAGFGPSGEMLEWLANRPWDEHRCVRCGGDLRDPGQLPWS